MVIKVKRSEYYPMVRDPGHVNSPRYTDQDKSLDTRLTRHSEDGRRRYTVTFWEVSRRIVPERGPPWLQRRVEGKGRKERKGELDPFSEWEEFDIKIKICNTLRLRKIKKIPESETLWFLYVNVWNKTKNKKKHIRVEEGVRYSGRFTNLTLISLVPLFFPFIPLSCSYL